MKLVVTSNTGECACIQTEGEIRLTTPTGGMDLLHTALGSEVGTRAIVLGLHNSPHLDSSGVSWLLSLHKHCLAGGGILVLHSVPQSILNMLKLLRVDRVLNIAEDERTACRFARKPRS